MEVEHLATTIAEASPRRFVCRHWRAVALATASAGCAPYSYGPVAPHEGKAASVRAEITSLDTRPDFRVHVRFRVAAGAAAAPAASPTAVPVSIVRALLAPLDAEPCSEGVRERDIVSGVRPVWLRPVELSGDQSLDFVYSPYAAHELLKSPTALDVVLSMPDRSPVCLRIPLTGTGKLAWTRPYHAYAGQRLRAYFPTGEVDGFGAAWDYGLAFGGQVGRVRAQIDGGVGTAVCRHACMGDATGFGWVSFAPAIHVFAVESGGGGLDLGLGYRFAWADVSSRDRSRSVAFQGPELTLRFADVVQQGPGLPGGSRVGSSGIELIFADWSWQGPAGTERALTLGFGVAYDAGF